jgi:hypothetical protein
MIHRTLLLSSSILAALALAYYLANFLRQLALPQAGQGWTLTTLSPSCRR